MKIRFLFLGLGIFIFSQSQAQTTSWNKGISCIVYSHCTSCHNPNGLAPTSFTTYQQVYNSRFSIQRAVNDRKMPPYMPNTDYQRYAHEKKLSADEINLINQWVNEGAALGDTTGSLPIPIYNNTTQITQPDIQASIPNFTIPSISNDLYQAFVITNPLVSNQYISEIEVIPGNRNIVHHVLVFQDTSRTPVNLDSAGAGPGYVSFGGIGSNTAQLVATWVPGSTSYKLPPGMSIRLNSGSRLILQIHYPIGSTGQTDSTQVRIKLSPGALRNVSVNPILNRANLTNGPLLIPANTVKTFHSQFTVPGNVTLISVGPHAHLFCKMFEVFGITPQGDTIKIIKIDDWDFHWQGNHDFQRPIKIPAGTILHGYATYDNTSNNPENPNTPPQDVRWGEATTDEMMLIYFAYLPYQNGDENIIVDTSSHSNHYMDCIPDFSETPPTSIDNWNIYPNPTNGKLHIQSPIGNQNFTANVYDMQGRLMKYVINENQVDTGALPSGTYLLIIHTDSGIIRKKFIKATAF